MIPTERGVALLDALRQSRVRALVDANGQPPGGGNADTFSGVRV